MPNYESLVCVCPEEPCGIHEESPFIEVALVSSYTSDRTTYDPIGYCKKVVKAYHGQDEDSSKYIKKIKAIVGDVHDQDLESIRMAMKKVKWPRKLDISVFHKLTGRLPHEDLNDDDERLLFHFCDTFYNESIKLFGKTIRCRTNIVYHLLDKVGKEPNADSFQFMKGPSHQRTEEEIKFVFDHLGWDYSPIKLV